MVQLIMTRNLKRRILGWIARFHAWLFPPKPYVEERWVNGRGDLVEKYVQPGTVWPVYVGKAFIRKVPIDPFTTLQPGDVYAVEPDPEEVKCIMEEHDEEDTVDY